MIKSIGAPAGVSLKETFVPLRNTPMENIPERLEAGDQFWIDMIDPEPEEINWLETSLNLHPAVAQDLRRDDRRPNLMVYREYIFLSLFQPKVHLHQVSAQEIHCIIGDGYFVTVRKSTAITIDNAYNRVVKNIDTWQRGVEYFLYLTMQAVVDSYYPLLDDISNQLSSLEEKILTEGKERGVQNNIYRLKQQLIQLRQMIAPQREVLASAIGEERLAGEQMNRDLFRHLYERMLRIYDVVDSQRDLSSNVLDLLRNRESERLSDAVSRLTILSMIFLPLTFFMSLFELNFATTETPAVIPISGDLLLLTVIIAMVGSVGVMSYYFRKRGWL